MKWSEEAWEATLPVYEAILRHPFVRELADGTLPRHKFEAYIIQDSLYIDNYCRVLAHIASRMPQMAHTEAFLDFAKDGVYVEKTLHADYLSGAVPTAAMMSPACMLYTSVLNGHACGPVEAEAAAVLPCFWIYREVGRQIAATAKADNPYSAWIGTYSDAAFDASTTRAIAICDSLADAAAPYVRDAMTHSFVKCAKMEWLFWDSAYNLEKWKI